MHGEYMPVELSRNLSKRNHLQYFKYYTYRSFLALEHHLYLQFVFFVLKKFISTVIHKV